MAPRYNSNRPPSRALLAESDKRVTVDAGPTLFATFTGDAVTTEFELPAPYKDAYAVYLDGVSAAFTTNGAGTHLLITPAPAVGVKIAVQRDTAKSQATALADQSALPASKLEAALDRLTDITQELAHDLTRTMRLPPAQEAWAADSIVMGQGDGTLTPYDLGPADTRKGYYLGFDDATGDPVAKFAAPAYIGTAGLDAVADGGMDPNASAADNTAAYDALKVTAASEGKPIVFRAPSNAELHLVTNTLELGQGIDHYAEGIVRLSQGTSSGKHVRMRAGAKIQGRFIFDGGAVLDTVAAGYISGHKGLVVAVADRSEGGYRTDIHDVEIDGASFINYGEYGFESFYAVGARLRSFHAERCGVSGIQNWSAQDMQIVGGRAVNMFPGLTPGHYGSNAYGVSTSMWSDDRPSSNILYKDITVRDIPTWTALDFHSANGLDVQGCRTFGCQQALAFENHLPGERMSDISVKDFRGIGLEGGSVVRDSVTCYTNGGITVNASSSLTTRGIRIEDVYLDSHGDARPALQGGAGITLYNYDGAIMNNLELVNTYQLGIQLRGSTADTDEALNTALTNFRIAGINAKDDLCRALIAYERVTGFMRGGYVSGTDFTSSGGSPISSSAAESYHTALVTSGLFDTGTIVNGVSATASDNVWV